MKHKSIIILLGIIILNSQFSILNSQNIIRPKISCPNDIYVNSYNGVLFYQRADLSIPNRSMPLEAVFYYNSSYADTNYGYGNGWTLGYEYRYTADSTGVTVMSGDGRKDFYSLSTGGSYQSPAGVFHILTALSDGGYSLRTKEGVVYTFADTVNKQVTEIRDRNNNTLSFAYTNGHLDSISDNNGRSIILTWTDSLLTSLKANVGDRTWQYSYDTLGNLVSVTNPMGYTVHYGYDKANRINRFTDEAGYSTLISYTDDGIAHRVKTDLTDKSIRYDMAHSQTVIVDYMDSLSNNQFTTYKWDERGRVIEKTGNCCGYTSKLTYDDDNNVIRSEDANGNVTTYTFDSRGNMLTRTDPMGYTDYYTYELTNNNILTHTDKLGNQYSFSYDTKGNLTSLNGPMGSTEQFTYNNDGQLLTQTDALGHTTTYTYDQHGNLISTTNPLGNSVTIQYNYMGDMIATLTPTGARQQYVYDNMQRPTSMIDPLGSRISLQYDSRGNALTVTDPLGHQIHTTYDAINRPVTSTDARQATSVIYYDANGNIIHAEDPLHHAVRMAYNDRNQIILAVDALGDSTHYEYDAVGNLIMATLPNGRQIVYSYDANSRLVQVEDQYGIIQKTQYDAMGRTIATINAIGDTTRMTYDALGRLAQTVDPLGHTEQYVYDLVGHLLAHTDANGNTTHYTYDAIGQLISERDALNNVTTYTYNADGELTSVTDANGNASHYQYDAAGQLTKITFANGKTQQFWYDAVGNVIRHKDEAGNQTLMAYDANGNLTSRTYPDGSSDQYTYDLLGNMLTANNANANITFTYDANGQVLSETLNNATTAYTYNARQGKSNITYPNGRSIEEQYDLRGRLTSIFNSQFSIVNSTYTPTDHLASRTYANGDHTTFTYDPAGRLTSISAFNSQLSILNLRYAYDPAGNILSRLDSLRPDRSETYAYDALHRLTEFCRGVANNSGVIPNPLKQVQYTLDALGNRISVTTNGTTTTYAHNNTNAYTTVGNETKQYDGNGNMISDGRHTYQYNYRNRMIGVDNGTTATYQYDALDRRVRKATATDTIQYYYRGIQCIEERTTTDTTTYIYSSAIDDILSMRCNGQDFYYHKNHLGSVMVITDSDGGIVETYDYNPYGTPTIRNAIGTEIAVSSIGNTIMFTGREYDFETGLYYFRARTMNPSNGRFMQHDPLGFIDSYNMYSYAVNNPIIHYDNLGLKSEDCQKDCNLPPSIKTIIKNAKSFSSQVEKYTSPFSETFFLWQIHETGRVHPGRNWTDTRLENPIDNISCSKNNPFECKRKKPDHTKAPRRPKNNWQRVSKTPIGKVTKKFLKVIEIHTRIEHILTLTENFIYDRCNGKLISMETFKSAMDVVSDYEVRTATLYIGMDIGYFFNDIGLSDVLFDSFENYPNLPKNPTVIGL